MLFHHPRKRFAQHFLCDNQVKQHIIAAIAPQPKQHLVEIGAGEGALTLPLLQYNCPLDILELDRDLIELLKQKTNLYKQLRIYNVDVLKFDFQQLITDEQPLRIIGNLPYNISTQLLFYLLKYANNILDMIFMLQKEVVDRMIALPATSNYGRLSVMLQYHVSTEKLFDVKPNAFRPPPKVNSSVVQLIPHSQPPVAIDNYQHFSQIVALAFSQRRKTLRNTLKKVLDSVEIKELDINPQLRAENLTLSEFSKLANKLTFKLQKNGTRS